MQITSLLGAAVMAMGVVAQSECQAQFILDACLDTHEPRRLACLPNDWSCMCEESRNIRTCYNNCPDDPIAASVDNEVLQYCSAMSATMTTSTATSSATVTRTSNGTSSTTETSTATETTSEDEEATTTTDFDEATSTASPTETADPSDSGAEMLLPKGVFFGALVAAAGLVL